MVASSYSRRKERSRWLSWNTNAAREKNMSFDVEAPTMGWK